VGHRRANRRIQQLTQAVHVPVNSPSQSASCL
jgi:hypothetical protein